MTAEEQAALDRLLAAIASSTADTATILDDDEDA